MRNKINYLETQLDGIKAPVGDADELSKKATTKDNVDINFHNTKYQLWNKLDLKYNEKRNTRWETSSKGRETWKYIKSVDDRKIYSDFYLNQVITEHGIFPKHQAEKFNKVERCLCNLAEGTVDHVLKDCILIDDVRTKYFTAGMLQHSDERLEHRDTTQGVRCLMQGYCDKFMALCGF